MPRLLLAFGAALVVGGVVLLTLGLYGLQTDILLCPNVPGCPWDYYVHYWIELYVGIAMILAGTGSIVASIVMRWRKANSPSMAGTSATEARRSLVSETALLLMQECHALSTRTIERFLDSFPAPCTLELFLRIKL